MPKGKRKGGVPPEVGIQRLDTAELNIALYQAGDMQVEERVLTIQSPSRNGQKIRVPVTKAEIDAIREQRAEEARCQEERRRSSQERFRQAARAGRPNLQPA